MLDEAEFMVGFPQPAKWLINLRKNIIDTNKDIFEIEADTVLGKTRTIHFHRLDENKKIINVYELTFDHSYENRERIFLLDTTSSEESGEKILFDKNVKGYILDAKEFPVAIKVISNEILKVLDLK